MSVIGVLEDVIGFIESDNWMYMNECLIFGWKEFLEETGDHELAREAAGGKGDTGGIGRAVFVLKQVPLKHSSVDRRAVQEWVHILRSKGGEELLELGIAFELIRAMRGIVRRSQPLDLLTVEAPIEDAIHYFREATVCYLFGLFAASVMLCRSALESILEHKLASDIPHFSGLKKPANQGRLEWLIETGRNWSILREGGDDLSSAAHRLRKFSNKVVHQGRVPTEQETRDHLEMLRTLACRVMRKRK